MKTFRWFVIVLVAIVGFVVYRALRQENTVTAPQSGSKRSISPDLLAILADPGDKGPHRTHQRCRRQRMARQPSQRVSVPRRRWHPYHAPRRGRKAPRPIHHHRLVPDGTGKAPRCTPCSGALWPVDAVPVTSVVTFAVWTACVRTSKTAPVFVEPTYQPVHATGAQWSALGRQ